MFPNYIREISLDMYNALFEGLPVPRIKTWPYTCEYCMCVEDEIKPRGSCQDPVILTEGMSPS